jgi:hypothetical protein
LSRRPTAACGLCREVALLCKSHLLPRAFYRLFREEGIENPNPHFLTMRTDQQTPHQVADYLLCDACEQILRRNGEDWILHHCYRGRGIFRLYKYLANAHPVLDNGTIAAYEGTGIPEIDTQALAYFGSSVFWRGAVKNWHIRGELLLATDLGRKYQEQFRSFLIGDAQFPDDAVMSVIVSRNPEPLLAAMFPITIRQNGYFHHRFQIPGISFELFVGREVPTRFKTMCIVHSQDHAIFSSDIADRLAIRNMIQLMPD